MNKLIYVQKENCIIYQVISHKDADIYQGTAKRGEQNIRSHFHVQISKTKGIEMFISSHWNISMNVALVDQSNISQALQY